MYQTILRLALVKQRTGMSRSSIYNGIREGTFPAQISLGARAVGWIESSIDEWIQSRIELSVGADAIMKTGCFTFPTPRVRYSDIVRNAVFSDKSEVLRIDELSPASRAKHDAEILNGRHAVNVSWPNGQRAIMYCDPGAVMPEPGDVIAVYKRCLALNHTSPIGTVRK